MGQQGQKPDHNMFTEKGREVSKTCVFWFKEEQRKGQQLECNVELQVSFVFKLGEVTRGPVHLRPFIWVSGLSE